MKNIDAFLPGCYEISTTLGQGGFGQVFKARHKASGQEVAIKVLQLRRDVGAPSVSRQIARFQREMQLCARLDHPNIVPLFDSGQVQEELLYCVFKFIPGQTLKDILAQEVTLSIAEAIFLMSQVLAALSCAHGQNIVHRDIKPANIMLTQIGSRRSAMVLDFGLGTVINSDATEFTRLTAADEILGTPAYAAPEQLRGEACAPGSDLYAWGLVFLECLSGRNPMHADTLQQVLMKQLGGDPVPIPHKLQNHAVAALLQAVLHKEANQRNVTTLTLMQQLQRLSADLKRPSFTDSAITVTGNTITDNIDTSNVADVMEANDVGVILAQLGLQRYVQVFTANDIDVDVLPELTETDLENLGLSLGARKKLLRFIQTSSTTIAATKSAVAVAKKPALIALEQRQLTILVADLDTGNVTDPEDITLVRQKFSACCGEITVQHNGTMMPSLGSAWLICFGYPVASEHSADQALRAAIALISYPRNATESWWSVSIGIATGNVLLRPASDVGRTELDLVGEIPILAQQLQLQAPASTVYITEQCKRLLTAAYSYRDLGEHYLQELAVPVQMWQVLVEAGSDGQHTVLRMPPALTSLVGRENELAVLLQSWQLASNGNAQLVLLSGEAGIGKSRLLQTLQEQIHDQNMTVLSCFCSPYHQNSALHPLIGLLQRYLAVDRKQSASEQWQTLRTQLWQIFAQQLTDEMLCLFAELLSIPVAEQLPALLFSPQKRKQRTLDNLLQLLTCLARQQPVLWIFEDLHWLDPTSHELLEQIVELISAKPVHMPILLLMTGRPEFEPNWAGKYPNTTMVLQRLGRQQGAALINEIVAKKTLPTAVLQQLLSKTDGVPLFIEELTKTTLESGILQEHDDHYVLLGNLPGIDIPSTLQDSITARLDRLHRMDKELLQVGAILGRQFSPEVLTKVTAMQQLSAESSLQRLIQAELIYRRGSGHDARYFFKHALVQDAVYISVLRSKRQELHLRCAQVLEEYFPEFIQASPELLAYHFAGAGRLQKAIQYWRLASLQALQRSAFVEAVNHCQRALQLLDELAQSFERDEQELGLRTLLAKGLLASRGYTAAIVADNHERIQFLCEGIGDAPQLVPTFYGQWTYCMLTGDRGRANRLLRRIKGMSEQSGRQLILYSMQGVNAFYSGHFGIARKHLEQAMSYYDLELHKQLAQDYGDDAALVPHQYHYRCLWLLGYADQARIRQRQERQLAEQFASPYVTATTLFFEMLLWREMHDADAVRMTAGRFLQHCEQQNYPFFKALASIGLAWAAAQEGASVDAVARIKQSVDAYRATGASLAVSFYLTFVADACVLSGRVAEGMQAVNQGLQLCNRCQDYFYQAELLRLKGELLLLDSQSVEAENYLRQALTLAERQQARTFALRAALSLARLMQRQGFAEPAHQLLAEKYHAFSEGFDSPDLVQAKQLLQQLC